MGDVTMPGCSYAEEEPLDVAGLFHENNPTLNLDDENPVMNPDNGVEGENPEYAGDEVEPNFVAPIPVWPPAQTPFNCSYCQVLREIIHQNAMLFTTNAINEPPTVNHQMVDFTMQSMESVKQFIIEYCQNRTQEGYVLVQDPLCYGLNWFNNVQPDEPNPPPYTTEAHRPRAEEENQTPADTNDNDATTPRP
ncbi:hypothetical protein C5167_021068 [Papaver somniferum]|uniref:Uncharacterized protein n=1 Tax=Papaver somniferum TaxID=3469 RepID=A0A4Y7IUT4_PAPSO|nr:hypothetical protein C5167_021068 [Papaver somniferum]